jgi:hypothetical protein
MKRPLVMIASLTIGLLSFHAAPSLAACLEERGDVLTCKNSCNNCDSLKTACTNGGAKYEGTSTGGKCTVGDKEKRGTIKSLSAARVTPKGTLVEPNAKLKASPSTGSP